MGHLVINYSIWERRDNFIEIKSDFMDRFVVFVAGLYTVPKYLCLYLSNKVWSFCV